MATLQSITSGNFTSSSTWRLAQATTFVDSIRTTSFIATTVTTNATTAFTPGAITISGISLNIQGRVLTPLGTLTVRLWNNTAGSIVKDVVINVSDLPSTFGVSTTPHIGWVYFEFDTNVTLLAATAYTIRVFTSNGAQVSIYTSSLTTSANLSKALITTTNQAPAATDILLTSGTYTTATGPVTNTITMNNTAATVFGLMSIAANGVMNYGTASSTNYLLTLAGSLLVGAGGTLTIGTITSPIPSTSTAILQLTCTTALQYVIGVSGTMITYGSSKTIATKLAADVIVGATNSITTTSTGWATGDLIVVPSTTRTYTQSELLTLTSVSGTTLTHNAYTNAHGGNETTLVQADVVNLTRNVTIRSTTGTLLTNKTNIQMFANSVTSFYYTSFIGLGTGGTTVNSGICVTTLTTGSFDFQYNVVREIATRGTTTTINTALQTNNLDSLTTNISNNIFYNLGWSAGVPSGVIASINDNNYFIGCLSSSQTINANFAGSGNVFTSNNFPATINAFYSNSSNNSFYSNGTNGLSMTISNLTTMNNNLSNFRFWRNNQNGIQVVATSGYNRDNILSFTGSYFFGNTGISITIPTNIKIKIFFSNCYFFGGTTLVQPNHFTNAVNNPMDSIYYDSCYFGYLDSSLTSSPFSTAILTLPTSSTYKIFNNCYFNSTEATVTTGYPYSNLYGGYRSLNHDGLTGSNIEWTPNGTITTDTTYYSSSSKSTRLTPNTATYKLTSPIVRVPVKSGNTCNISVNIRETTTLDGAIYNGTRPRLMYAFNPTLGNLIETVGDTTKNLFQYPQNFDNAYWAKSRSSITPDSVSVVAPDGTFTADLFSEDSDTNRHRILLASTINVSIGTTYNLSLYAKKATHDWIQLNTVYEAFSGNNWANFNLNTGIIGNTGVGASASITPVGDGWYRLSLQCDVIASGLTFFNLFVSTNNTNSARYPSYTGTNAQCFYIWGAQFTLGSNLLPYYDNGQWETLTYTTATFSNDGVAEFYVDCDGSTGWINIDDWNTTTANDSRGQDYWGVSGVYIEPTYKTPTRASGYIN